MTRKFVEDKVVKHLVLCLVTAGVSVVTGAVAIQQGVNLGIDGTIITVMNKLGKDEL